MKFESANFTIYEVEDLKEQLLNELNSQNEIKIDFINIEKVDMTAIQLLVSLKKSCDALNKSFEILNISDNIFKAFQLSGCDTILGV